MWYKVRLRVPGCNERMTVEVDACTGKAARREVLRALADDREWSIDGVEPVYCGKPDRKRTILRAVTIAASVLVAATLLLLTSCAGAPPAEDLQPVRATNALVFHSGGRVDQEGTPLLTLSGSHHEVGLQYGVLLRPEIRSVYGEFGRLPDELSGGGLRRAFFRFSLNGQIESMRAALPPGFEDELRGIAEGARIRFSDFLFFALTPELLFDMSCTSLVVRRGDEIAQGRNFDFSQPGSLISRYPVIARIAVEGKVPYINVGFAGLPGSLHRAQRSRHSGQRQYGRFCQTCAKRFRSRRFPGDVGPRKQLIPARCGCDHG